ncbi:bile acid:sodium symporter [Kitasatospora sp. NBC_00240]|uniref:bile acid:sodium symporter family protein n=1 Tax=Kitasatospora sp. NBC_00240 TaxID=2903567 RepID=UPI0022502026|nr:bile acid:sodium symporter family protein [Kitasatospora sp. NBC_00240]MCX5207957.1 bile acid:sodium symporter [Kitasatospora sp. NBC_00240]
MKHLTAPLSRTAARFGIDPYILALLATVGLALLLPARGAVAGGLGHVMTAAIAVLFFLYGARLSTRAALDGARHWRLHLTILLATFALFPLLGLAAEALAGPVLSPELAKGLLFLCLLPSTVQSSIAFTSLAGGSVAGAVCAASFSSLFGILLTPLLASLLLGGGGAARVDAGSVLTLVLQLLVPFLLGQLSRRWTAGWIATHKPALTLVDRGSILLVVYTAFSEGVVAGVWHTVSALQLLILAGFCVLILAAALTLTQQAGRRLGFVRADRVAIVFCGSKKSLAAGLPMAAVLFAAKDVALMVLPLMLFHQIQLMTCTVLARRWAAEAPAASDPTERATPPAPSAPRLPHRVG